MAMKMSSGVDVAGEIISRLVANIETVIRGQSSAIQKTLVAMISGGHVLLEDFPGTGKTTLAKALAMSIDATFKRIQFTPDLLPTDIIGVSIYDQRDGVFNFHEGPIFANIVLADEINRASPRTQSALLEAMAEAQVTVDGEQRKLDDLFFVIATQNPIEFHGAYPLPESQMDRFAMHFSLGYVPAKDEVAILSDQATNHPIDSLKSCASLDDVLKLKNISGQIRISEELKRYIVDIVAATRDAEGVSLGASPRASLAMMKAAQATALIEQSEFVTPDHIRGVAIPVIAHRLALDSQARFSGLTSIEVVEKAIESIAAPA